jgi:hypothetical protein
MPRMTSLLWAEGRAPGLLFRVQRCARSRHAQWHSYVGQDTHVPESNILSFRKPASRYQKQEIGRYFDGIDDWQLAAG